MTMTTFRILISHFRIMYAAMLIYWHWEAMLISYLATRVITLPFRGVPELVDKSNFRIGLIPGSYFEDVFKYETDPHWQLAWKKRIQPYVKDYQGYQAKIIKLLKGDSSLAIYDNYFSSRSEITFKIKDGAFWTFSPLLVHIKSIWTVK